MERREAKRGRGARQPAPPSAGRVALRSGLLCACPVAVLCGYAAVPPELWPSTWPLALFAPAALLSVAAVAADRGGLLAAVPFPLACSLILLAQLAVLFLGFFGTLDPETLGALSSGHHFAAPRAAPDQIQPSGAQLVPPSPAEPEAPEPAAGGDRSPQQGQLRGTAASTLAVAGAGSHPALPPPPALHEPARLSVVLPCAGEGEYAVKTALKVVDRTPAEALQEVIVVDDGSDPTIESDFDQHGVGPGAREGKGIRIIRHPETLGLMVAKQTGGAAARGDIVVFFDCHVSPQLGWHEEITRLIVANPKRMVVPAITDLDLDTWDEAPTSNVNTKCYLTWQAEFDWFDDDSPYVPVMSGGLLALSAYWWNLTGGYDGGMRGWGGENIDQSLRSWLCGGEIMRARSSRVAHMWRTGDPRTRAHYRGVGSAEANKRRVVAAWFGDFRVKFPGAASAADLGLDVSGVRRVQQRLGCKPLVHFLHRFRAIYVEGGVIPPRVFQLEEVSTGSCVQVSGDSVRLDSCRPDHVPQFFHWGNRVARAGSCCSGIRHWDSDACFDYADAQGHVHTYPCDITGTNRNQQYKLESDGRISHQDGRCLAAPAGATRGPLELRPCAGPTAGARWRVLGAFEPVEARLYREGARREGLQDAAFWS